MLLDRSRRIFNQHPFKPHVLWTWLGLPGLEFGGHSLRGCVATIEAVWGETRSNPECPCYPGVTLRPPAHLQSEYCRQMCSGDLLKAYQESAASPLVSTTSARPSITSRPSLPLGGPLVGK
jgi:hypothetical protein